MYHRKMHIHINFQKNRVSRSVKNCAYKFICQKIASCINLQLPILILKKSILLDMHHDKTYMYINFQQNQVITQVMTVHTSYSQKTSQVA